MTNLEQIQYLLDQQFPGKSRTDSDVLYWIKGALGVLLRLKLEELQRVTPPAPERSYADRADSATSFDPELQSDEDAEREPIHMEKNP